MRTFVRTLSLRVIFMDESERKRRRSEKLQMTWLEEQLRKCFRKRPDVTDHILTGDELTDYIRWMAETEGAKYSSEARKAVLPRLRHSNMNRIGQRFLAAPEDISTLEVMTATYNRPEENDFFVTAHDISVDPVLRFMPAHWHQNAYFEVLYCFSGTCPLHFPDEIIDLSPGSVAIIAPDTVHATPCYSEDTVVYSYLIRSSTFKEVFWNSIPQGNLMTTFFRRALETNQTTSYLQFETEPENASITDLLYEIEDESRLHRPYNTQLMNAYMSTFFILLLRSYEGTARLPKTADFTWKHEYSAILSYIQTHISTVSLSELARRFHYSEKQISRIVRTCTGEAISDLLTRLRMERAQGLLRQGELSMDELALASGYSTVNSFYRAFKAYYGCPPKAYIHQEGRLRKL